jgi:tRNA A-37 threonylcarbamoyl transferase component Bud32
MSDPSTWSGRTLGGRYQIEERLGTGGMATVYKATDPNLKRVVAIKLIHPHLATDPLFVRRFEEEATAVAQLRHPNIVQVYDYNHEGQNYYIVFEFVPGETLQERLRRLNETGRQFSYDEIRKIASSMTDALGYAHTRGLIHRDIKPANIMLNVYGDAILTDFGIAKIAGGATFTATGATIGTAQYMSPEQIKGEHLDGRSDLYSLGVTLYEMVSGKRPFESESAMTLMMMHINDPVPNLREIRPEAPAALTAVIEKTLAKDRDLRYASAADMQTALGKLKDTPAAAPVLATVIEEATLIESAPVAKKPVVVADKTAVIETAPPPQPPRPPQPVRERPAGQPPVIANSGVGDTAQRPSVPAAGGKSRLPLYAGIGAVVLLLFIAVVAFSSSLLGGGDGEETPTAVAETSATPATPATPIGGVGGTAVPAPNTPAASATFTATPTKTPPPTDEPTATEEMILPVYTPPPSTPTAVPATAVPATAVPATAVPPTAAALSVYITNITLGSDGHYVVSYETTGYTETLPGMHVHFFFDTVSQANAGVPGTGPWILYGGPRPFTQYTTNDRPAAATQMCALVANPDHSILMNSGNCYNLP